MTWVRGWCKKSAERLVPGLGGVLAMPAEEGSSLLCGSVPGGSVPG